MSDLRIAIDVDGVLCNCFKYWEEIAEKEGVKGDFKSHYNGIFKVRCGDGSSFGDKLFNEYREDWITNSGVFPDVPKFIRQLNEKDLKWYIVTARTSSDALTLKWLDKHNIVGFEDAFFIKDKTKSPCNVILDDKPSNVDSFTTIGRGGVIMDRSYNKGTIHKRITNLLDFFNYYGN